MLCLAPMATAQRLVGYAEAVPKATTGAPIDVIFCNGLELTVGCGGSPGPGNTPRITLEQLSPLTGQPGGQQSIQFRAGWPLIFRATVDAQQMVGIGRLYGRQGFEKQGWAFPEFAQGGAVVLENPDGFWSFVVPSNLPHDELLVDFFPDSGDVSGTVDDVIDAPLTHDPALRFALRPEFGGPLPKGSPAGVPQNVVQDGVQFGTDDDFTGLVIVSNVGVGVVMSTLAEGWTPLSPRRARNLAGFTNSVGYELSDTLGRTSITSTLIVPRYLFSRIRLRDLCTGTVQFNGKGEPISCSGPALQRVDGGALTPLLPTGSMDESIVELRAFVVAPVFNEMSNRLEGMDTLTDMNGDGRVSAVDAQLMGRQVLSNELVFNFRQIGTDVSAGQVNSLASLAFCNGLARPDEATSKAGADLEFDLDGNGYAVLTDAVVCPGGSTGVTQPPR
jgi:hypothetical protein